MNQSAHGAPAEPRAAAANDGILTSGGPNREKRVSARVAKKVADDAAKNAKAATRKQGKTFWPTVNGVVYAICTLLFFYMVSFIFWPIQSEEQFFLKN